MKTRPRFWGGSNSLTRFHPDLAACAAISLRPVTGPSVTHTERESSVPGWAPRGFSLFRDRGELSAGGSRFLSAGVQVLVLFNARIELMEQL